jgi:hypothetical protein
MAFPLPDKPSIAVLPFTNMSGEPKQEYFAAIFPKSPAYSSSPVIQPSPTKGNP